MRAAIIIFLLLAVESVCAADANAGILRFEKSKYGFNETGVVIDTNTGEIIEDNVTRLAWWLRMFYDLKYEDDEFYYLKSKSNISYNITESRIQWKSKRWYNVWIAAEKENRTTQLEVELNQTKERVTTAEKEITTLKTETAQMQQNITNVSETLETHESRLAWLENKVRAILDWIKEKFGGIL
jgi:hypothetical protein